MDVDSGMGVVCEMGVAPGGAFVSNGVLDWLLLLLTFLVSLNDVRELHCRFCSRTFDRLVITSVFLFSGGVITSSCAEVSFKSVCKD